MTDELDVPLGREVRKRPRPVLLRVLPHALAAVLLAALAGFAVWIVAVDDPWGGEPLAIASVGAPTAPREAASASPPSDPAAPGGGAKTVTVIDGMSGKRREFAVTPDHSAPGGPARVGGVTVTQLDAPPPGLAAPTTKSETVKPALAAGGKPSPLSPSSPAPAGGESRAGEGTAPTTADPRVTESTPQGPLPKIGAAGVRPAEVYASPLAPAAAAQKGSKIAIVVGRLGVSAKGTEDALTKLPAAISVAFTPYGADLDTWIGRARKSGREVLLQVPMEPFDYPDNDPGPKTLLTSLSPEQNLERLHWFMSRFAGYVGIGNYMGTRFAANEPAVSTVMRDLAKRGLIYFDDGTATRSLVSQVAAANNVPYARADLIVDAGSGAADMDAALARLETIARERGTAVGVAIALPSSVERLAQWAASAGARGITLVPISVIANKAKSS